MSYKESDIVYEKGNYFAIKTNRGFEVYRTGITHSTRVAAAGPDRFNWVKTEIERRVVKELEL